MTRNARGYGSKPKKWRDRWRASITVGWTPEGKQLRRFIYGKTQAECAAKLDAARRERDAGVLADRSLTVAAYLEDWIERKSSEVSARTIEVYRAELAHVRPRLGRVKLADLRALDVERAMRSIDGATGGSSNAPVTLSARAANRARSTLGAALADAVRLGLLALNPVDRTRPLREEKPEIRVWTGVEIVRFLDVTAAGGAAMYPLFRVALATGLRVGELAALERRDVETDRLFVRRGKTPAARRTVPIAADTRGVLDAYWRELDVERVSTRLALPTSTGGPVSRSNVRKALHRWAAKASVPAIRPHDLRHTFASMMIANGTNPAELARLLGHTSPAFTLSRYVHFFERVEQRSAPTLRELVGDLEAVQGSGTRPESN